MNNDTSPATKADIAALEAKMTAHFDAAVGELKRYFDVMVETMRHDFQDAYHDGYHVLRDRQTDHERRLNRLERYSGLGV